MTDAIVTFGVEKRSEKEVELFNIIEQLELPSYVYLNVPGKIDGSDEDSLRYLMANCITELESIAGDLPIGLLEFIKALEATETTDQQRRFIRAIADKKATFIQGRFVLLRKK